MNLTLCRLQAPCKGCENRSANCHGCCELYQEYVELKDEQNMLIRQEMARKGYRRY